jgi:predicted anti-sigma-YlaC factor YlaD
MKHLPRYQLMGFKTIKTRCDIRTDVANVTESFELATCECCRKSYTDAAKALRELEAFVSRPR